MLHTLRRSKYGLCIVTSECRCFLGYALLLVERLNDVRTSIESGYWTAIRYTSKGVLPVYRAFSRSIQKDRARCAHHICCPEPDSDTNKADDVEDSGEFHASIILRLWLLRNPGDYTFCSQKHTSDRCSVFQRTLLNLHGIDYFSLKQIHNVFSFCTKSVLWVFGFANF